MTVIKHIWSEMKEWQRLIMIAATTATLLSVIGLIIVIVCAYFGID